MYNFLKDIHTTKETAYIIEDYPYGRLRTKMYVWIEYKKGKGYRVARQTINPKNGKENKPHFSTYSQYIRLYIEEETQHVKSYAFDFYSVEQYEKAREDGFFNDSNIEPHHESIASHMMRDSILYMTGMKRWVINGTPDTKEYPQLTPQQTDLLKTNTYTNTKIVYDEANNIF